MVRQCLAVALVQLSFSTLPHAPAQSEPRGVIELFTSQGCSSCPAADKLLGELASDPALVVMSVPIDYWDYLGWKDTLANPRNTARQRAYARIRGDGQIYTPQVVVNGSAHVLGSDKSAIEHAIGRTRQHGAMSLPGVTLALADGHIKVAVPEAPGAAASAETWLYGLTKAATVTIGRGENKGRTITYHNVARRWLKLGDWAGPAKSFSVPLQTLAGEGIHHAVVLVQSGSNEQPKAILGAGFASLR